MDLQIWIGYLLSISPFFELRVGLPVVVESVLRNGGNIWPHYFVIVFLNAVTTIFILFFLDSFHKRLLHFEWYRDFSFPFLLKIRNKAQKFEKRFKHTGYTALAIFVGIPLPGSGTWTGSFIAWTLNMDRRKSIIAITIGVIIASFLVLLLSLGVFGSFYNFK